MSRPTDEQIVSALDDALRALWRQYDAMQQLAMRYPEAHAVLSSPRKPDAIIIIERVRHAIADTAQQQQQASALPGRGEGE